MPEEHPLLTLAALDADVHRYRTRLNELPERAQLLEAERALAVAEAEVIPLQAELDVAAEALDLSEARVADLTARKERTAAALYGGAVTDPAQLQALEHEQAHLAELISAGEDDELDKMGVVEEITARRDAARAVVEQRRAACAECQAAVERADAETSAALASAEPRRPELVAAVEALEPAWLARYDKTLARGVMPAAAELAAGICGGCRLRLPAGEVDRLRAEAAALPECPECGCLLVISPPATATD